MLNSEITDFAKHCCKRFMLTHYFKILWAHYMKLHEVWGGNKPPNFSQVFRQYLLPLNIEKKYLHGKINVFCIINSVNKNKHYK